VQQASDVPNITSLSNAWEATEESLQATMSPEKNYSIAELSSMSLRSIKGFSTPDLTNLKIKKVLINNLENEMYNTSTPKSVKNLKLGVALGAQRI
jgi:hypothetical protein